MSSVPLDTVAPAAEQPGREHGRVVQVWDLPLRIFHWSLVIAITAAYVTGEFGGSQWAHWHGRIGAFVLALLVFRLIWGIIGTHHARFRSFVPTPGRIVAYLRGSWEGAGHNPLGALSVLALLLLLAAQVLTGLFSNDDISFAGPWSNWIDKTTSDWLTGWHQQLFNGLAGLVGLHLVAILFYFVARRQNLVAPMITGERVLAGGESVEPVSNLRARFLLAVSVAVAVTWFAFRDSPVPPDPSAAPSAATADW